VEATNAPTFGEGGLSLLEGKSAGVTFLVHCIHDTLRGVLLPLGASEGEIDLLGCMVAKPAGQNCTVPNLIPAKFTAQLSEGIVPATDLVRGLGANEEFANFKIEGIPCSAKGNVIVEGLQTVELPGSGTPALLHDLVFKKSGSKLKSQGAAASFSSTAKVKLVSDLSWLVVLGS
jgi:hypothetical protein